MTRAGSLLSVSLVAYLLIAGCATATRNRLSNPGFEANGGRESVPAGWEREGDPLMSPAMRGPFALVRDARHGRWAAQLETEEWNFLRPQRLTQEVKLPADATLCHASAWAKGRGLFTLVLQFRKGGKPMDEEKIDMGFGPVLAPKEVSAQFALEGDYQRYEMEADVPRGADAVLAKVGNTVGLFGRLNVFGRAVIDDVSLRVESGPKAVRAKPSHWAREALDVAGGLTDIAPSSRIEMEPPSFDPKALVDGDTKSQPTLYRGCERGAITRITFPEAAPVLRVALFLGGNADSYVLRGDADGDGVFERLLDRATGMKGKSGWVVHDIARTSLKAISVQGISGDLWGFRSAEHFLREIKVLALLDAAARKRCEEQAPLVSTLPKHDGPVLSFAPAEFPIERKPHPFRKMVCADLWMWGINKNGEGLKKADILASKGFRDTAKTCKDMGVDTIFIDLTNSSCWNQMPWPSKVCNGTKEGDNPLKELIAALHESGFKAVVQTLHNFTPFEPVKWHYPCEETLRYPGMKPYPSILFGSHVRDNWLTIYREMLDAGADGVCLGSDEFYYRGTYLRILPTDDPARQAYKERYGEEIPARAADTLAYRRWLALRHEALGKLFGHWSAKLRAERPGVFTCSVFMQPVDKSNLYVQGVPFDVLGALGGIEHMGSDYMDPYGIRSLVAANGWRKATQLFSGNMYSSFTEPAVNLYGPALWMLMHGGGSCSYWRYYQIKLFDNTDAVKHGYAMVDDLMALGAWDARPPQQIAVLSSRASTDWWQVKAFHGTLPQPNADRGIEARRGWFHDEWVVDRLLLRNGYPFEWKCLDWPDKLGDLSQHKVIILPFAYSISDAAAAKVRDAVAKGSKLILFGKTGETDEWGEPRKAPAFHDLVESGKATLVADDLYAVGGEDRFRERIKGLLDASLGADHPLKAEIGDRHVDIALIQKSPTEKFLFLINWEKQPSDVGLSLAVPDGRYRLLMRDDLKWHKAAVAGREVFSPADLRRFRVAIPPLQGMVLYLHPEPVK